MPEVVHQTPKAKRQEVLERAFWRLTFYGPSFDFFPTLV